MGISEVPLGSPDKQIPTSVEKRAKIYDPEIGRHDRCNALIVDLMQNENEKGSVIGAIRDSILLRQAIDQVCIYLDKDDSKNNKDNESGLRVAEHKLAIHETRIDARILIDPDYEKALAAFTFRLDAIVVEEAISGYKPYDEAYQALDFKGQYQCYVTDGLLVRLAEVYGRSKEFPDGTVVPNMNEIERNILLELKKCLQIRK